ncbi:radical SAM protein [Chloroflexota bacterium]
MSRDTGRRTRRVKAPRVLSCRERLAREQGTIIKDWGGRLSVALVYPNSYYIGMSNLGVHTVYSLLNNYSDIVCERVFLDNESLHSLESRRPLADFDVIALSISYELDYFNVVSILKESGIPLYAADRNDSHPLVVAGGACITANPMPLAPFFDCLCIGEAEKIIPSLLETICRGDIGRQGRLAELAKLPGVYAPQHCGGAPVVRQWLHNLDNFMAASVVLTPDTELGNLYLLEVERGCNWGCRFCLVSSVFCPLRYHSIGHLLEKAEEGLKHRQRIGLVGPAVSAHPQIEELLHKLTQMGAAFSLSSLRVSPLSDRLLDEVVKGGARTLTLAPEAGSQRLRDVINKRITQEDILRAVSGAAAKGIRQLKLYFMIGLPTETDDDIRQLIELVLECKDAVDKAGGGCRLVINASPFIPKPWTPFQWLPMAEIPVLNRRLDMLKKGLAARGVKVKSESPAWSHVQGALARGDTKIAAVLVNLEDVSLAGWRKALEKQQLNADYYTLERRDTAQKLPWYIIDMGVSRDKLVAEMKKAVS